jgi:hypothetical protein
VVLAQLRQGRATNARATVSGLQYLVSKKTGAVAYSAAETVVNSDGDVFYPYASVAGTGWAVISCAASQKYFWSATAATYASAAGQLAEV